MRISKALGQNLTELALCLAVVTTALVSMQLYLQRGAQVRLKQGTDYALTGYGEYMLKQEKKDTPANLKLWQGIKRQFDPKYSGSTMWTRTDRSNIKAGFPHSRKDQEWTRWGSEKSGF